MSSLGDNEDIDFDPREDNDDFDILDEEEDDDSDLTKEDLDALALQAAAKTNIGSRVPTNDDEEYDEEYEDEEEYDDEDENFVNENYQTQTGNALEYDDDDEEEDLDEEEEEEDLDEEEVSQPPPRKNTAPRSNDRISTSSKSPALVKPIITKPIDPPPKIKKTSTGKKYVHNPLVLNLPPMPEIDELVRMEEGETSALFEGRRRLAHAISDKKELGLNTVAAVHLASCLMHKVRYGTTYSDSFEQLINMVLKSLQ